MATEVTMPQMGESIAEGTIVRWIKKVGDTVDRDEPLFEISTDKVDAEIPSPAEGVLTEIKVQEGETVAVNSVVALISEAGEVAAPASKAAPAPAPRAPFDSAQGRPFDSAQGRPFDSAQGRPFDDAQGRQTPTVVAITDAPQKRPSATPPPAQTRPAVAAQIPHEEGRRQRSSPLVRRIAREHNVDVSGIQGSGLGGRVTKNDILGYVRNQDSGIRNQEQSAAARAPRGPESSRSESRLPSPGLTPDSRPSTLAQGAPSHVEGRIPIPIAASDRVEPLSVMRKKIAEHMILSRRTSAHVHSVFHVNFSTIERIRQQKKAEYEQRGTKLTYMAFIAQAVIAALRRFPIVNA
jgi:pyruvate dehydrogenase E2 component (dihydrolipoamide acetyltransferase)